MTAVELAKIKQDLNRKIGRARPIYEQYKKGELVSLTEEQERQVNSFELWEKNLDLVKQGVMPQAAPKPASPANNNSNSKNSSNSNGNHSSSNGHHVVDGTVTPHDDGTATPANVITNEDDVSPFNEDGSPKSNKQLKREKAAARAAAAAMGGGTPAGKGGKKGRGKGGFLQQQRQQQQQAQSENSPSAESDPIKRILFATASTKKILIDSYVNAQLNKQRLNTLVKEYELIAILRRKIEDGQVKKTKIHENRLLLADALEKQIDEEKRKNAEKSALVRSTLEEELASMAEELGMNSVPSSTPASVSPARGAEATDDDTTEDAAAGAASDDADDADDEKQQGGVIDLDEVEVPTAPEAEEEPEPEVEEEKPSTPPPAAVEETPASRTVSEDSSQEAEPLPPPESNSDEDDEDGYFGIDMFDSPACPVQEQKDRRAARAKRREEQKKRRERRARKAAGDESEEEKAVEEPEEEEEVEPEPEPVPELTAEEKQELFMESMKNVTLGRNRNKPKIQPDSDPSSPVPEGAAADAVALAPVFVLQPERGLVLRSKEAAIAAGIDGVLPPKKVVEAASTSMDKLTKFGHAAVARLQHDLKQIKALGMPNINFLPLEDDLFNWRGNIALDQGPLAGLIVHLEVKFSDFYPQDEPIIKSPVDIPHPCIAPTAYSKNTLSVLPSSCLTPYTPAIGIVGIVMQLQGFFTVDLMSKSKRGVQNWRESVANFVSTHPACPHSPLTPWPPVASVNGPFKHDDAVYAETKKTTTSGAGNNNVGVISSSVSSASYIEQSTTAGVSNQWRHAYSGPKGKHSFRVTLHSVPENDGLPSVGFVAVDNLESNAVHLTASSTGDGKLNSDGKSFVGKKTGFSSKKKKNKSAAAEKTENGEEEEKDDNESDAVAENDATAAADQSLEEANSRHRPAVVLGEEANTWALCCTTGDILANGNRFPSEAANPDAVFPLKAHDEIEVSIDFDDGAAISFSVNGANVGTTRESVSVEGKAYSPAYAMWRKGTVIEMVTPYDGAAALPPGARSLNEGGAGEESTNDGRSQNNNSPSLPGSPAGTGETPRCMLTMKGAEDGAMLSALVSVVSRTSSHVPKQIFTLPNTYVAYDDFFRLKGQKIGASVSDLPSENAAYDGCVPLPLLCTAEGGQRDAAVTALKKSIMQIARDPNATTAYTPPFRPAVALTVFSELLRSSIVLGSDGALESSFARYAALAHALLSLAASVGPKMDTAVAAALKPYEEAGGDELPKGATYAEVLTLALLSGDKPWETFVKYAPKNGDGSKKKTDNQSRLAVLGVFARTVREGGGAKALEDPATYAAQQQSAVAAAVSAL